MTKPLASAAPLGKTSFMRRASVLISLLAAIGGCEKSELAPDPAKPPAGPCSLDSMLARDTSSATFEDCGEAKSMIRGKVLDCLSEAMSRNAPVKVRAAGSSDSATALIVGADFGDGYEARLYTSSGKNGERSAVEFSALSPGRKELALMPQLPATKCIDGRDQPTPGEPATVRPTQPQSD